MGSALSIARSLINETCVDEWPASRLAALTPEKEPPADAHPEFFTGVGGVTLSLYVIYV
jgi:hypothetical protein